MCIKKYSGKYSGSFTNYSIIGIVLSNLDSWNGLMEWLFGFIRSYAWHFANKRNLHLLWVYSFMLKSCSTGVWYVQKRLIVNLTTVTLLSLCESFSQSKYPACFTMGFLRQTSFWNVHWNIYVHVQSCSKRILIVTSRKLIQRVDPARFVSSEATLQNI